MNKGLLDWFSSIYLWANYQEPHGLRILTSTRQVKKQGFEPGSSGFAVFSKPLKPTTALRRSNSKESFHASLEAKEPKGLMSFWAGLEDEGKLKSSSFDESPPFIFGFFFTSYKSY